MGSTSILIYRQYVTTIQAMKFEWDTTKRQTNIRKHGIDFEDARKIFFGPTVTIEDPGSYGESRYLTVGMMENHIIVIIHTERQNIIRLISARKATKHEQKYYFQQIGN
jgi:uncharacterized protein